MSTTTVVPVICPLSPTTDHTQLERDNVHSVYDCIASHFDSTRFKPWPVVVDYLSNQAIGSFGCDVGCGNGKYLKFVSQSLPHHQLYVLGIDRSSQLISICNSHGLDAVIGDALDIPCPDNRFDFVISIAVIHHLSSEQRRVDAIRELLRILKPSGTALIYVWAFEQGQGKKQNRQFPAQDCYVPWHLSSSCATLGADSQNNVYQRYYHLFQYGELQRLVGIAGGSVVTSGYDRDNHYCVISMGPLSF